MQVCLQGLVCSLPLNLLMPILISIKTTLFSCLKVLLGLAAIVLLYSIGYDSLASPFCEINDDTIEIDYPFKHLDYDVRLLGTCNGLVCIWLYDYEGGRDFLCLWNPATTEYKEIPKSPNGFDRCEVCLCALGYDCKTDDYKLATGIEAYGTKDSSLVQVYTLTSNSWRNGQIVPYKFPYMQNSGVLVDEYLHWLAKAQGNIILLSLDMGDESFKEVQLPMDSYKHPHMILGELEGCLCILVSSYANGFKLHVEVWKMLDYGVGESWARYYVISHESIIVNQLFFEAHGVFQEWRDSVLELRYASIV
ncbi:F-box protein CPR1-like [Papaver somniferum]|uniref:F-box protein CPR1-like n=1 Tax=Papaver somniferum TaxID=3469 RepID=UPI000E6F636C|nr:F-box protein CPR1-like [Papaver somniferum]XP_026460136.1 F-box protein CPR1-like [Papaver somniferum]XP_026460137.1 F-box protein CPR1-like [Papaver somniferum]